jgi:hypothetical protein
MSLSNTAFKDEIHRLAEDAFHQHLISGYGDSEYADKYQIVYQGKPRHLTLRNAYAFLKELIGRSRPIQLSDH